MYQLYTHYQFKIVANKETLWENTRYFVCHQVWFQNQRAKMKKIQKKQRLDNKNNKDGACGEEKSDKIKMKEEEQSE